MWSIYGEHGLASIDDIHGKIVNKEHSVTQQGPTINIKSMFYLSIGVPYLYFMPYTW